MVFKSCLVERPILFFGDVLRLTVVQSEVIRIRSLNVTHRVQEELGCSAELIHRRPPTW